MMRCLGACALLVVVCGGSAYAAGPAARLVVTSVAVSQHGGVVLATDVVRNAGSAASRRSRVVWYAGSARVGGRWVPPLRAGATSRGVVRLTLRPGSYRLRACAARCLAARGVLVVRDVLPPVFAGLESAVTCIPGPVGGPVRSSSWRLTWKAARDDGTPAAAIVYDVYQATVAGGEDFSAPTYTSDPGATTFTTPPLPDDTGYFFVVRARDRAGNEDRNRVEQPGRNLCL
jgi:hypothetical protein